MSIRKEIEKLNSLEKALYCDTAVNLAMTGVGYACDWKLLLYLGGACVLSDCYKGITLNNDRNELIRRLEIQERFGGGE